MEALSDVNRESGLLAQQGPGPLSVYKPEQCREALPRQTVTPSSRTAPDMNAKPNDLGPPASPATSAKDPSHPKDSVDRGTKGRAENCR
jgi:hypothetical protein